MAKSTKTGSSPQTSSKKKKGAALDPPFARLCLITPPVFDLASFAPLLDAALASGAVASLIIATEGLAPDLRLAAVEKLVPIAQANGAAAILTDSDLVVRAGADGLHVTGGIADLRRAVDQWRPDRIVGSGDIHSRHEAMLLAETECDYLFFGRFDGDDSATIHDKTLDLAAWWSALFEIPAVVMGGTSLDCIAEAAAARIEFIALRAAVWDHPEGPAAAVEAAARLVLAAQPEGAI
ncbi:thiamine-phosphate pyrophosphorylase [Kaistia soli DSM 19436]|uniref:Thiamine-phosphate pyrophosphorylase n=1 Tax=Kaistia soli DSM 19436 TaxID=1122133 RepID=A0A1M5M7U1_9HYPH|nr:thiamine phosphate synthase [Kaistia soli]SHG73291.1 thiamine-phosphate pyrophosphorylase [Kaistia soli DSM 19436]